MSRTRKLTDMAIMIAVGIVINMATFPPLGIFGRISLVYTFCYITGVFLGPLNGMIAAMAADALGWLLLSHGGPFVPQIMLSNGLMACFSGLCYKYIKWNIKELRIIPSAIISFVVCTLGLSAWGESMMLFDIYPYTLAKTIGESLNISSPYLMIAISKSITQPLWIAANILISIVILKRVTIARQQFEYSLESFRAEVQGSKVKDTKTNN